MRQTVLAVVLIAVGAGGFYLVDHVLLPALDRADRPSSRGSGSGQAAADREIVALGRLEPARGVVSVSALPGERIAQLNVSEGAEVSDLGTSLGVLVSHELRQVELEGLRAQLAAAKESHKASLHVAEARVAQAQAALQQAEGSVEKAALQVQEIAILAQRAELAKSDYDQLADLSADDADLVSPNQLQRQQLAWQTARSEHEQATRSLAVNQRAAQLTVQAAQADLAAAEASLDEKQAGKSMEALEKQVEAAELNEQWARLPAPTTGIVLKTFLRPGEFVTETPILQMADLSEMICIAEVFEADAKLIHRGDKVTLTSSAFAAPFDEAGIPGTVSRIGQLIAAPGIANRDPLARADRHVVEMLVEIDPQDREATAQAAALVGLQVNVRFMTSAAAESKQ